MKNDFAWIPRFLFLMQCFALGPAVATAAEASWKPEHIQLPPGFKIEIFASGVSSARGLALGPEGTVFAGSSSAGKIYAIRDGKVTTLASGLDLPIGVDYRDGVLYSGSIDRILRYEGVDSKTTKLGEPKAILRDLPSSSHHGGRYLRLGPDGRLYVGVGAPCNVCLPKEGALTGTILSMKTDGTDVRVHASGVRNSVGFDWQPGTKALWFTDNGRDLLGDDVPPDELNRAARAGLDFGFPYCHAGTIADPEFTRKKCAEFQAPARKLGPHVAALGMRFYTGKQFPAEYRGDAFIAEHGSWNRSSKIGYRIMRVKVRGDKALTYEPFAQGWLRPNGEVVGRPVDLLVHPDGSLLVSDDQRGVIYRIRWAGDAARN